MSGKVDDGGGGGSTEQEGEEIEAFIIAGEKTRLRCHLLKEKI